MPLPEAVLSIILEHTGVDNIMPAIIATKGIVST